MSLTMTKEEREAFLAEVHVAIISIPESGRGPLVYRYLGAEEGKDFIEGLGGDAAGTGDVLIRIKPKRWLSEDYSKNS